MDFGRVRVVFWKGFGGITNDYKRLRLQNLLWWLGRRGADQWRSTNHWKGSWMVRQGPKKLDFRWGQLRSIALFYVCFLRGFFLVDFWHFGAVLKGFGRPKWEPKSNLETFFAMFFSSTFGNRFFGDFFLFFSSLNLDFCAHSQYFKAFSQNRRFLKK